MVNSYTKIVFYGGMVVTTISLILLSILDVQTLGYIKIEQAAFFGVVLGVICVFIPLDNIIPKKMNVLIRGAVYSLISIVILNLILSLLFSQHGIIENYVLTNYWLGLLFLVVPVLLHVINKR